MATNIEQMQEHCVGLLEKYINLLKSSDQILYQMPDMATTGSSIPKYDQQETIEVITRKIDDVRLLQIRVPIVAPMKAGKSTIINAVIGIECLPTRMDAMTSIPTAVVLKLGEPINEQDDQIQLVLEKPTIEGLQELLRSVVEILKDKYVEDTKLNTLFVQNEHLVQRAKQFRDAGPAMSDLSTNIHDPQRIKKTLTWINDLIRIAIYIRKENPKSHLSLNTFLKNIPEIHVNYRPIGNQQNINRQKCRMLLIDTPGPNEAAGSDQLAEFVNNQLKTADVILNVIEYGQINTKSDEEIAKSIDSFSVYRKNHENNFILINKIDRRQHDDMSLENLYRHVATMRSISEDRVFGLSGYHAIVVQRFLKDYPPQEGNLELQTSPIVQRFYQTFYPNDWEDQVEECTPRRLKAMTEKLYKKSGIADIIDKVLETVLNQVVKRCIHSALDLCDNNRRNVIDHVQIRLSGLQTFAEQLRKEVDELAQDLHSLGTVKEAQSLRNENIIDELESELQRRFDEQLQQYKSGVTELFGLTQEQWKELDEQFQQGGVRSATTFVAAAVGGVIGGYATASNTSVGNPAMGGLLGALLGTTAAKQVLDYFLENADQTQFENYQKAKEQIDGFSALINNLSNKIYKNIEEDVSRALQHSSNQFHDALRGETKTIIDRASQHLQRTFQTELHMDEKSELTLQDLDLKPEDIGHSQSLNILSRIKQWFTNASNNNNQIWILSRSELRQNCLTVLEKNVERMRKDMIERTMEDMKLKLDSFLNGLQEHLETYRKYADLCLLDKNRTRENQDRFQGELIHLQENLSQTEHEFNTFRESLPWNQSQN